MLPKVNDAIYAPMHKISVEILQKISETPSPAGRPSNPTTTVKVNLKSSLTCENSLNNLVSVAVFHFDPPTHIELLSERTIFELSVKGVNVHGWM